MTRETAIALLNNLRAFAEEDDEPAIDMAIEALSAEAVQGEWVIRENGNKECSLCGHERQDGWDYFCGYCGARMKGGAE